MSFIPGGKPFSFGYKQYIEQHCLKSWKLDIRTVAMTKKAWKYHCKRNGFASLILTKENIPILPFGILDFCMQKLLAPPVEPMYHLKRVETWAKSKKSELDVNDDAIIIGHVAIQWVIMITSLPNMSTRLCNPRPDCAIQWWVIHGETLSHLKSEQQEQEQEEEEEHQTVKTKKAPLREGPN